MRGEGSREARERFAGLEPLPGVKSRQPVRSRILPGDFARSSRQVSRQMAAKASGPRKYGHFFRSRPVRTRWRRGGSEVQGSFVRKYRRGSTSLGTSGPGY